MFGNITLDLSSEPLGCDTMNADYAFVVSLSVSPRLVTTDNSTHDKIKPGKKNKLNNVQPTKITKIATPQFNIYPNPCSGQFSITLQGLNENENSALAIYNVLGEKIYDGIVKTYFQMIDLSNKPRGVYFIKMIISGQEKIKKLIIQ